MTGLKKKKIGNDVNFEGVLAELEAKHCFQRQSFTKYLR